MQSLIQLKRTSTQKPKQKMQLQQKDTPLNLNYSKQQMIFNSNLVKVVDIILFVTEMRKMVKPTGIIITYQSVVGEFEMMSGQVMNLQFR